MATYIIDGNPVVRVKIETLPASVLYNGDNVEGVGRVLGVRTVKGMVEVRTKDGTTTFDPNQIVSVIH